MVDEVLVVEKAVVRREIFVQQFHNEGCGFRRCAREVHNTRLEGFHLKRVHGRNWMVKRICNGVDLYNAKPSARDRVTMSDVGRRAAVEGIRRLNGQ
jgi:hypothetical protein